MNNNEENPVLKKPRIGLKQQIDWMAGHWKPYVREVPILLGLILANAAVAVSYPYLIKWIIDGIEESRSTEYLVQCVLLLMTAGVAHFGIYAFMQFMRARLNIRFEFGMRIRVFEHLLRMGPSFFTKFRTGDLVTRLMDDVGNKIAWYMCSGIFRVIEALAIIVFGVIMMISINPVLTLYTAGPLPILVGLFVVTAGKLHKRYEAVQQSISDLNDSLESCFSGIRVVKAFAAEDSQQRIVEQTIDQQRRAEIRAVRWQTVIDSIYGNIWQLAIVGVLLAGGIMVIDGEVTLGDLVAFDSYVLLLVWPMFDIGQFLVRGKLSAVSVERIDEVERSQPEVLEIGDIKPQPRRPDDPLPDDDILVSEHRPMLAVKFDHATYRFPDSETNVLDAVSFAAKPGQLIAVVGEIGSGKSTAISLIPRLMDPDSGTVLIGEKDLKEWNPVELRQAIGYVSQEAYLLSGTVLENIRFGREWIDDDDIDLAISISQLQTDIAEWPEGLETIVGSRGIRISGGQKQRVALARALAGRPSILLLDDCTASLDAETEEAVWQQLIEAIPNCTTILVTHRPTTLERADEILVLDRGIVRERGTFAELNRPETYFHRLYMQWKLLEEEYD